MTRAFDAISSISVIADDQLLYSTDQNQRFNREIAGAYYQNAIGKPDKIFWSNLGSSIFFKENGERTEVLAAYGAIKGDDGSVIGLLVVEFLPNSFNNLLLQNQEILNFQYTFMVDRNDQIICADINGYPSYCSIIEKKFNEGTRRFEFEWNGEQYYACGQYNGLTGWKTFSVISVRNLFADSDALKEHIEILLVGAVSFMLLAIFLMPERFSESPASAETARTPSVRSSAAPKKSRTGRLPSAAKISGTSRCGSVSTQESDMCPWIATGTV